MTVERLQPEESEENSEPKVRVLYDLGMRSMTDIRSALALRLRGGYKNLPELIERLGAQEGRDFSYGAHRGKRIPMYTLGFQLRIAEEILGSMQPENKGYEELAQLANNLREREMRLKAA